MGRIFIFMRQRERARPTRNGIQSLTPNEWRETEDREAYQSWAEEFKPRVAQSIQKWIGRAGYEAGKLLRALTGLAPWGIATGQSRPVVVPP